MLPFSQKLIYKNVFAGAKAAVAISSVILAKDFPVVEFVLCPALTGSLTSVVGNFIVGEKVTGGTSATTGIIAAVTSTTITLINVSGTFTNAETITGGTSGATATIGTLSVPNFTIGAFTSDQRDYNGVDNPPDPTKPSTPTNSYSEVSVTNEVNGVNYSVGKEYNPTVSSTTDYTPYTFRFGTDGQPVTGKWAFLEILAYTSGALVDADIILTNS